MSLYFSISVLIVHRLGPNLDPWRLMSGTCYCDGILNGYKVNGRDINGFTERLVERRTRTSGENGMVASRHSRPGVSSCL